LAKIRIFLSQQHAECGGGDFFRRLWLRDCLKTLHIVFIALIPAFSQREKEFSNSLLELSQHGIFFGKGVWLLCCNKTWRNKGVCSLVRYCCKSYGFAIFFLRVPWRQNGCQGQCSAKTVSE
jgi:hypothetical protein